jgi:hypothetical protein
MIPSISIICVALRFRMLLVWLWLRTQRLLKSIPRSVAYKITAI